MRRLALLATVAVIVLLLVLSQLLLPGIAAQRLRDRLSHAPVRCCRFEVHAFPAIELLWHHADRVVIRMASYRSSSGHLSSLLDQLGDVGSLDASAAQFSAGLLRLRNASLRKRGDAVSGSALVNEGRPARGGARAGPGHPGRPSAADSWFSAAPRRLLGVTATVNATVAAVNGQPAGPARRPVREARHGHRVLRSAPGGAVAVGRQRPRRLHRGGHRPPALSRHP